MLSIIDYVFHVYSDIIILLTQIFISVVSSVYHIAGSAVYKWPYILAILGVFTVVTMWAVVVAEGYRKIKLQYYGFKLASATRCDPFGWLRYFCVLMGASKNFRVQNFTSNMLISLPNSLVVFSLLVSSLLIGSRCMSFIDF